MNRVGANPLVLSPEHPAGFPSDTRRDKARQKRQRPRAPARLQPQSPAGCPARPRRAPGSPQDARLIPAQHPAGIARCSPAGFPAGMTGSVPAVPRVAMGYARMPASYGLGARRGTRGSARVVRIGLPSHLHEAKSTSPLWLILGHRIIPHAKSSLIRIA